jgi:predicted secreted protein
MTLEGGTGSNQRTVFATSSGIKGWRHNQVRLTESLRKEEVFEPHAIATSFNKGCRERQLHFESARPEQNVIVVFVDANKQSIRDG